MNFARKVVLMLLSVLPFPALSHGAQRELIAGESIRGSRMPGSMSTASFRGLLFPSGQGEMPIDEAYALFFDQFPYASKEEIDQAFSNIIDGLIYEGRLSIRNDQVLSMAASFRDGADL